jgi:UDP-GlcNAc:undecaprenyl-phosphate/decaprenyl-phosphate GlcNAc-1-phosphate transferase
MILKIALGFLLSFLITYVTIPSIIQIAKIKNLCAVPNERASHDTVIPTLGGLGIFVGFVLSICFWTDFMVYPQLQFILFALVLIFLLGVKDDIIALSPMKKTIGILIAAVGVVVWGDIRITSFYGLFGVEALPYYVSVIFTIFTIFAIINAFNLIDGINGLCSSTGIISSIGFGIWFFLAGDEVSAQRVIMIASLVGALLAFLRYNITPAQIFMGDTGSLILGLMISIFAIEFIEANNLYTGPYKLVSAPIVAVGFMILPLTDMAKVFVIRLSQGKSPFYPDRNHIHHLLLKLGLSHTSATLILSAVSVFFVALVFVFERVGSLNLAFILFGLALVTTLLPNYILYQKEKKQALSKKSTFAAVQRFDFK